MKNEKNQKFFFEMKLKSWNPYGLRITHTKFESNQRQKFFSVSKGGPFGVFLIFKVSMWRRWSTIMDINGGIDSLERWNSDVNGCLNNQRILKQIFDSNMSSSLIMRQKLNTGHYGPAPTVNIIPELAGNRVK